MDTDTTLTPRQRHSSFVIRVWRDGAAPDLRGSVQLVGRQTLRYFTSLERMRQIVADALDADPRPAHENPAKVPRGDAATDLREGRNAR